MPPILFATESSESRSLPLNAQRLINFFTEKQPQGAKSQTPLFAVPGMSAFSDTSTITGAIAALGSITGGSSYGSGIYNNVPLTGGSGRGALATVTVSPESKVFYGPVRAVAITYPGIGYQVGDVLSASNSNLGGVGSGFSVPVATLLGGGIATFGSITGGSGYSAGISTYQNVPLTVVTASELLLILL